ncbi:MAG: transporter [Bacteroidetes bacterium]|nr:transporter [Bacteroidota bacterium]
MPPIILDRPDLTESPFLTPKGYVQVEAGLLAEKTPAAIDFKTPTVLFKYGLTKKFELRLIAEMNWTDVGNNNFGVPPVWIGFKSSLIDEKGIVPQVSFIGHLALDEVATSSYKEKHIAPKFRFVFQHTLSKKFSIGYNAGMEWDGATADPALIYTLTSGYAITDKFGCFVELFGDKNQNVSASTNADAGFTFLVNNNAMADISGGLRLLGPGLTSIGSEFFISMGYSFRFNTSRKVETIFVR